MADDLLTQDPTDVDGHGDMPPDVGADTLDDLIDDIGGEGDSLLEGSGDETGTVDGEEPGFYGGKYKTVEDLEAAYKSAEQKIAEQANSLPTNETIRNLIAESQRNQAETGKKVETNEEALLRFTKDTKGFVNGILEEREAANTARNSATTTALAGAIEHIKGLDGFEEGDAQTAAELAETNPLLSHVLNNWPKDKSFNMASAPGVFKEVAELAYWAAKGKAAAKAIANLTPEARRNAKAEANKKARMRTQKPGAGKGVPTGKRSGPSQTESETINRFKNAQG